MVSSASWPRTVGGVGDHADIAQGESWSATTERVGQHVAVMPASRLAEDRAACTAPKTAHHPMTATAKVALRKASASRSRSGNVARYFHHSYPSGSRREMSARRSNSSGPPLLRHRQQFRAQETKRWPPPVPVAASPSWGKQSARRRRLPERS